MKSPEGKVGTIGLAVRGNGSEEEKEKKKKMEERKRRGFHEERERNKLDKQIKK